MTTPRVTDVDRHVGAAIRSRRLALGMTCRHLGEAAEVHPHQIHKYESGANRVAAGRLQRIAEALGCEPRDLFPSGDPVEDEGRARLDEFMALAARLDEGDLGWICGFVRAKARGPEPRVTVEVEGAVR